jgi:ADP-ribose pyrophosphatase
VDDARRRESRQVFDGRLLDVAVDRVELPNGEVCDVEVIRHPGAAAVVPLDDDDNVLMVRQYRYASGGWLLEVPAGKLDGDEPPEVCAAREVEEETGYRVGELHPLGWIWTTPGFSDEKIWLFVARGLERSDQSLERDEVLTVERRPLSEMVEAARRGEIHDAKTICALLRAADSL